MRFKDIQTKVLLGLSVSWISSAAFAGLPNPGPSVEKDPFELYDIVRTLGEDINGNALGANLVQLQVGGCSVSETQTLCLVGGKLIEGETSGILFDAIQDVFGSEMANGSDVPVSRVRPAEITCSLVVYPGATPKCTIKDPFELFSIVKKLGKKISGAALGASRFKLHVGGCTASETQTACKIGDEVIADETSAILFQAIQKALGSVTKDEGTRVPGADITCSLVVYPGATPKCTIEKIPLFGGGNSSVGGKSKDVELD